MVTQNGFLVCNKTIMPIEHSYYIHREDDRGHRYRNSKSEAGCTVAVDFVLNWTPVAIKQKSLPTIRKIGYQGFG